MRRVSSNSPSAPIIAFPALRASRDGTLDVVDNEVQLTTCSKLALRKGYFDGLAIYDSAGMKHQVEKATKLHGVGPFWGYDIFLDQRIMVRLLFRDGCKRVSTNDVRQVALRFLRKWGPSRGDYEELCRSVQEAGSISEILRLLADPPASL